MYIYRYIYVLSVLKIIKYDKKNDLYLGRPGKQNVKNRCIIGSKITTKQFVRKLFTFLSLFRKKLKNIFKICSYIQKITPNPINALEITNYNTTHTKNTQMHFTNPKKTRRIRKYIIYLFIFFLICKFKMISALCLFL